MKTVHSVIVTVLYVDGTLDIRQYLCAMSRLSSPLLVPRLAVQQPKYGRLSSHRLLRRQRSQH